MVLKIYASMNYAPRDKFPDAVIKVVNAGIDGLHFDIPLAKTGQEQPCSPDYIEGFIERFCQSSVVVDIRLPYASQTELIPQYAQTRAQRLTLPKDAFGKDQRKLVECIRQLKAFSKKRTGISVKMSDENSLRDFGLMSVVNHFYIQGSDLSTKAPIYPDSAKVLRNLGEFKRRFDLKELEIIVEGNFFPETVAELNTAGASIIVVGPALFSSNDYRSYLDSLRHPSTVGARR